MPIGGFDKLFSEAQILRKGSVVQVRNRQGGYKESDSVEANILYEILMQLKKKND